MIAAEILSLVGGLLGELEVLAVVDFHVDFVLDSVVDCVANLKMSHWLYRLTDWKMCPETTENLMYLEMTSDLTTMDLVLAFVLDFVAYWKVSRFLHRLIG